ncbi:MAG: hypothetical protein R2867_26030 [Caldilineaceae bacterium]
MAGETTIAIQVENKLMATRVPAGSMSGDKPTGFMNNFPDTTFDFFPYGGLHRAVYLYSVPQTHITDVTVTTTVDNPTAAAPTGTVQVAVVASAGYSGLGELVIQDGEQAQTVALHFTDGSATATIEVANAKLWGPGHPHLYPVRVSLLDGEMASIATASALASVPSRCRVTNSCSTAGRSSSKALANMKIFRFMAGA